MESKTSPFARRNESFCSSFLLVITHYFIFLDEATNSLDAKNEREIVENLDRFYTGRTVVIVAHRLSTVKNADQIVVIDNGHIVEKGNHATLIAKKGAYYELVKNQLELGN